ncbi:hypothetical protein QCD60_03905 [Pokkaliibacter sp. MBI-7]|uniref:hypothetical protein n=1 Tax=Pokkaliibacter sp. MBI-7 TaxID=3040600 RepID=UPI0024493358|nr:hypothetical protein [Pokkaliibacter sp. MBI-7]MDH2431698.1 hypothetical protein [Pokkaliibacter sp. MBI-7]
MSVWKLIRLTVLLGALFLALQSTVWKSWQLSHWQRPVWVNVHLLNGDGEASTQHYMESLTNTDFADIETFLNEQAADYGLPLDQPIHLALDSQVQVLPPPQPEPGASALAIMWWSLELRWWHWWRVENREHSDVDLFLVLYGPENLQRPQHAFGIEKLWMGVVYGYASKTLGEVNNVILAHELLHNFGATDKYDPQTLYPAYPGGFAHPEQQPLLPQRQAELMAGRIPLTPQQAEIPDDLSQVVIGKTTAEEIGWLAP